MTKATNYLATVTDVNSVFTATGAVIPNSERCVIKDDTGETAGSVGAINHWEIDPTANPLVTYTNPRLPRWQDLVPLTIYTYARYDTSGCSSFNPVEVYSYIYYTNGYYYLDGGPTLYYLSNYSHTNYTIYFASASVGTCFPLLNCAIIDILSTNALASYYAFRLYQSTVGVASYDDYIIISTTNTARHILSNQTSATTSYMIAGFATSVSATGYTNFFRYGINIYKLKQDYPAINTFTFDLYGARLYETLQQFTIENSIKTSQLIDIPPSNGVDFQPATAEIVSSTYITTMCQPLNTYIKIGYFTLDTTANTFVYTNIQGSACTTTTTSTSTTTSTTTCNPAANWQWNGGYNCYSTCNTYQVEQDINPCSSTYGQTRQGSLYQTDTTICGGCCGQSTSATWVSNGAAYCDSCVSKQPQIDNNPCSPTYNQTQVVNGGSACNTTQSWVNSGNYNCYSTCNKYNVEIQNNPCASGYNTTRQGSLVESNSTFCGGCCGQSTAATWVNTGSYSCYSTCNKYNVEVDNNSCSPTYNQNQQGSLVESNSTFCGGCCGASTVANWVNDGATFCSGCTLYQPQIDNNVCSSTYGDTRTVNLGVSTACGACCGQSTTPNWVNSGSYNCYSTCNKYNVEVDNNPCSSTYNDTRPGSIVEYNSTFCGGCCGQSTSANWVNNGGTFCDGCNLQQPEIDNNPCSATYGNTRDVDLGVTNACGVWVQSFYCVGYDKWSEETNTCTGNVQNQFLVEVNSPYCGYVPPPTCRTYQIVGYNADEYVDGTYTNCGGGSDSFSFYGGPGTVGTVCAQISSVYITSGNGQATDIGGC